MPDRPLILFPSPERADREHKIPFLREPLNHLWKTIHSIAAIL